jgi:hypothetical protein
MSFICDGTTILKLIMNLYDDLPTNIIVMSKFAHSSNQGN